MRKLLVLTLCTLSLAATASTSKVSSTPHKPSLWASIFGGEYASSYSGYDLFINGSDLNTDEHLLEIVKSNLNPNSLLLSGAFQALLTDPISPEQPGSLNLTAMEVQSYATLNHAVHAFVDTMMIPQTLHTFFPRYFLTIGDLNRSKFYASVGKMYVPFGMYRTSVLNVLPEISNQIGAVNAKTVTLSMADENKQFNIRSYVYQSAFKVKDKTVVNGGLDISKGWHFGATANRSGIGVISNMADSSALSSVFADQKNLYQRVPGLDVRTKLQLPDMIGVNMEYVQAIQSFAKQNISVNGKTVKPGAVHIELTKNLMAWHKPVVVALGMNQTFAASVFNVPRTRLYGVMMISPFRRTVLSFEVNDDQSYRATDAITIDGNKAQSQDGKAHVSAYVLAGIYF